VLSHEKDWQETFYVRDAQGNVMAMYNHTSTFFANNNNYVSESFNISAWDLYGSSRLGTRNVDKSFEVIIIAGRSYNWVNNTVTNENIFPTQAISAIKYRLLGAKTFELTNHLGNVISTVSDRKLMVQDAQNIGYVHHYTAEILSIGEQYAFGMSMPGRTYSVEKYRYGMNTQEKDDDIFEGAYTAEYWEYDSRVARRWNIDPLVYEWQSPYACFNNNPVYYADPSGLEGEKGGGESRDFAGQAPGSRDRNHRPEDGGRNFKRKEKPKSDSKILRDHPTETNGPQPPKPTTDYTPNVWGVVKRLGLTVSLVLQSANKDYDSYGSKTGSEMDDYLKIRYTSEEASKVLTNSTTIPIAYVNEYNRLNPNNRIVFRYMSNAEYKNRITSDRQVFAPNLDPENFWCFKYITPDTYTSSKLAKSKLSLPKAPEIVVWTFEKSILTTKMPGGSGRYNKVKPKYNELGGGNEAVIFQPFPILGSFPLTK
jgi:hypothetical protein